MCVSVLKGEGKKRLRVLAKAKTLKRDFEYAFTVAYVTTKLFFNKPQLKHKDRTSLKDFQQQLKYHIPW